MARLSYLWLILGTLGTMVAAPSLRAQYVDFFPPQPAKKAAASGREYVPIPFDGDLEAMLRLHLNGAEQRESWQELLKKLQSDFAKYKTDPKNLPKLNLDDPQIHDLVKGFLDNPPPDLKLPAEQVQILKKALEQMPSRKEVPLQDQGKPGTTPPPLLQPPEKVAPADKSADDEDLTRWLRDWMERVEESDMGDWLRNSRAWQGAVGEIQTLLNKRDWRPNWGTDRLPRLWDNPKNLLRPLADKDWSGLTKFTLPELPRLRLPGVRLPGLGLRPRVGTPSVPQVDGNTLWQSLLWLVLLAAAGWMLWTFAKRQGWRRSGPPRLPKKWPVDPTQITTAGQLVQAFDFLALHQLGPEARPWNHRRIAEGLGRRNGPQGGNGQARPPLADTARHLAACYEVARYAPPEQTLTPTEIAVARQYLCLLAGVAGP